MSRSVYRTFWSNHAHRSHFTAETQRGRQDRHLAGCRAWVPPHKRLSSVCEVQHRHPNAATALSHSELQLLPPVRERGGRQNQVTGQRASSIFFCVTKGKDLMSAPFVSSMMPNTSVRDESVSLVLTRAHQTWVARHAVHGVVSQPPNRCRGHRFRWGFEGRKGLCGTKIIKYI